MDRCKKGLFETLEEEVKKDIEGGWVLPTELDLQENSPHYPAFSQKARLLAETKMRWGHGGPLSPTPCYRCLHFLGRHGFHLEVQFTETTRAHVRQLP